MSERPDLRASDADRLAAEEHLRANHLAGRLTLEEFEDRVTRAHKAVTIGDLAALQADLPAPAKPPAPRARAPIVPGRTGFAERIELDAPLARVRRQALASVVPAMARSGYSLELRTEHQLTFVHHRRPGWTIAVAILLFPFGLLALTVRDSERVVVEFDALEDGRCAVLVHGVAPLPVRRAMAELR